MFNWKTFWRGWGETLNLREPPKLPAYAWSYFDHLAALYLTVNTKDPRADQVIAKARENADDLTWGDIFLLENFVFTLQQDDVMQRNAWLIRERFREISCSTIYGKYVASNPPTETDTPAKLGLLRADLTRVLDILHWYYSLIPARERLRKALTLRCILWVVFYTALLIILLVAWTSGSRHHWFWISRELHPTAALAACVVYWGIIGGFVSSQRRMQSIPSDGDPLISVLGLDDAGYYLWLSPMLGAVFAVVLAWMFMGGFITGALFPLFTSTMDNSRNGYSFISLLYDWTPLQGPAEYAKLFVWSFLAGFAERLVPDNLDRLASKLDTRQQASTQTSLPAAAILSGAAHQGTAETPPKKKDDPIENETIQDVLNAGISKPDSGNK